jgi:hypothetical protein
VNIEISRFISDDIIQPDLMKVFDEESDMTIHKKFEDLEINKIYTEKQKQKLKELTTILNAKQIIERSYPQSDQDDDYREQARQIFRSWKEKTPKETLLKEQKIENKNVI